MSRDDWYRNRTWNARIEKNFIEKLSRARSQRDQYLAIQAIELASRRPEAALKLIELYFETRKNDFNDARALMAKANAHKSILKQLIRITTG